MTERIYIRLLSAGINVWRPVEAKKIADGIFQLPVSSKAKRAGEEWEFSPGSTVFCKSRRSLQGMLAAVRLADTARKSPLKRAKVRK